MAGNLAVARQDAGLEELVTVLNRVALDPGLLIKRRAACPAASCSACAWRTLVTGPEVLLLDEPTSALDEEPKRVFERTARDLAAGGITIIWVTHDAAQADRVADRIYRLRDGHLSGAPTREARP